MVDKVAYVLSNPVKHGLVERCSDWAGLVTRVEDLGGRGPTYTRPAAFFAESGPVSEEVELAWVAPPMCVAAYGLEGFRARVQRAVDANVAAAHAAAAAAGQGFVGMAAVAAQSPFERPRTPSGRSAGKKAKARQRVAGSDDAATAAAVERDKAFVAAYRAARACWAAGDPGRRVPRGHVAGVAVLWRDALGRRWDA